MPLPSTILIDSLALFAITYYLHKFTFLLGSAAKPIYSGACKAWMAWLALCEVDLDRSFFIYFKYDRGPRQQM